MAFNHELKIQNGDNKEPWEDAYNRYVNEHNTIIPCNYTREMFKYAFNAGVDLGQEWGYNDGHEAGYQACLKDVQFRACANGDCEH